MPRQSNLPLGSSATILDVTVIFLFFLACRLTNITSFGDENIGSDEGFGWGEYSYTLGKSRRQKLITCDSHIARRYWEILGEQLLVFEC